LALALAMRREPTWPTSPSCGEAPDAAGPPPPKTATWPWSPSRSRWSGLEELDERVDALRARYQPWLASRRGSSPVPSGSARALPSNTPGGVHNAPALTVTAFTLGGA
jgi:hypothetical protein